MHTIDDLTSHELNIVALAMEYFLCNYQHGDIDVTELEELFMHIDMQAEAALDERLVEKTDNLLVVDFRPKNG